MKRFLPVLVVFLFSSHYSTGQNALCQDAVVELGPDGIAMVDPIFIDAGSTGMEPLNMFVEPPVLTCENIGANSVTLTVMDAAGTFSQCTSVVEIIDLEQPVVFCNDVDDWGVGEILNLADIGTAFDNCEITETLILPNSFDQPGIYSVSLIAFDTGGSASTCISFVTVNGGAGGNTPPVVSDCPDLMLPIDFNCEYIMEDFTSMVVATDGQTNSDSLIITQSIAPGTVISGVQEQLIQFTVTDEGGMSTSCTSFINLVDDIPPTIVSCPDNQTEMFQGPFVVPDFASSITAFDNCYDNFDVELLQTPIAGEIIDTPGIYVITVMAVDPDGNITDCSFNLNLFASDEAVAVCEDFDVELDDVGQADILPFMVDGGSVAAEPFELTLDVNSFDCSMIGANFVTLTVTGSDGSSSSCSAAVTVMDVDAPLLICQDITVALNESDMVSIFTSSIVEFSVDNCGFADASLSQSDFTSADIGVNNVMLTLMDESGNVATCNAQVTVMDEDLPPVAVCQDAMVILNETGSVTILADAIDGGSTDDNSIVSIFIDPPTFDCSNIGLNDVLLTVEDTGGNASSCLSTVSVVDIINPVIDCVGEITLNVTPGEPVFIEPQTLVSAASDNCDVEVYTLSQYEFTEEDMGVNSVEVSVTDMSGNTSSCTAVVNVMTGLMPEFTCPGDISLMGDANCTLMVPDFQTETQAMNFCSDENLTYVQEPAPGTEIIGTTEVTMTVADVCGNTATCNFTLTVSGLLVSIENENGILSTDIMADNYQWYDCEGNPIPGENQASFTPTESGNYNVTVITNGCSGTSDCEEVIIAGLDDIVINYDLDLYPNPSNGLFNFMANSGETIFLTANIYNNLGQLILTKQILTNQLVTFDMQNESQGLYYIQIHGDYHMESRTFTIE